MASLLHLAWFQGEQLILSSWRQNIAAASLALPCEHCPAAADAALFRQPVLRAAHEQHERQECPVVSKLAALLQSITLVEWLSEPVWDEALLPGCHCPLHHSQ